jgi:sugar phosphate isomerase/epimerase
MTQHRELMDRVGVCSWSLRPTSAKNLAERVRACGVWVVQLHLDRIRTGEWDLDETRIVCMEAGLSIGSGMMSMKGEDYSTLETIKKTGGVRPSATWEENLTAAEGNAEIAAELRLPLVTFHAGFLPHENDDPERGEMVNRLRTLAQVFGARGVRTAFETGQETAETLEGVLAEVNSGLPHRFRVGVNFDPANMILYGMGEPVAALQRLARHVSQVHIKDAIPTKKSGTWGEEVPVGTGEVDWKAFFAVLTKNVGSVDLMIEREAREDRINDVRLAARHVSRLMS